MDEMLVDNSDITLRVEVTGDGVTSHEGRPCRMTPGHGHSEMSPSDFR